MGVHLLPPYGAQSWTSGLFIDACGIVSTTLLTIRTLTSMSGITCCKSFWCG